MTEATTATSDPTIDEIVTRAYRLSGLLPVYHSPNTQQASAARIFLDDIVKEVSAEGIFARNVKMTLVTVTESTTDYVLDPQVLDVVGNAAFIDSSNTDVAHATAETPVMAMTRDEWQSLSARSATGRPQKYWADRSTVPVTLRVWPMPDAGNVGTMRIQAFELPADVTSSTVTAPMERYWTQYLTWELAHNLAVSHSLALERCTYLAAIAQTKFKRAKAQSRQQVPTRVRMSHPTHWSIK